MVCPWSKDEGSRSRGSLQRQRTVQQEEQFKVDLEHLFEKHGNEGVQLHELEDELTETGITDVIPEAKLTRLLNVADADHNRFITYSEFITMYTNETTKLSKKERSAMRRFVGGAIHTIVPLRMREDFLQNYTCRPSPLFVVIVSLLELAVFVYYAVRLSAAGTPVTATTGLPDSPLMYTPSRRHEAWRFITYMLLHQGYTHLLFNLIVQLLLGLALEIVHKWWRILVIYVGGVIGGSLVHSVTDHGVKLVGASGGCYALIGAHLASVIINWKEMNYRCEGCRNPVRFMASAPFRLAVIFTLATVDTGFAVYQRFIDAGDTATKTGITAHIGGLISGLLLGVSVLKNVNKLHWETKLSVVTLTIYFLVVIFCIVFNGVYGGYPATDHSPCC